MNSEATPLHDFALRYTAAWCSQDPAAVAAHFSPEGSLTINGGAPAQGRAAITEAARSFMTDLPDLHLIMDGLQIQGDRAVYHWTLNSTQRRLRISGFEEWLLGPDGLIAESQGHFDSAEYARQRSSHGLL